MIEAVANQNHDMKSAAGASGADVANSAAEPFETLLLLPPDRYRRGEGGLRTKGIFKKSLSEHPLLSIITVVFNGAATLERTIRSVLNQGYSNIEYIIIDGGSTDGSVEIIQKYEDAIDYWVSEPDGGIYDAMNKGCRCALGDALLFLNADDYFEGEVFGATLQVPALLPVKYVNFFGKLVEGRRKEYRMGMPYCHQAIVFDNRKLLYDTSFRLAADYDYYLAHGYDETFPAFSGGAGPGYVCYNNFGLSQRHRALRNAETRRIIANRFGTVHALRFALVSWLKQAVVAVLGKIS